MVLVVVALALTVLMIFAAFAIDLGAARTARRKSQGTVDGGALGGGQLLVTETGTLTGTTAAAIADEVIAVTYSNLTGDGSMTDAGSLTPAQWRTRFESCTDPDRNVARFPTPSTVSDCISFNSAMTRVRVRLPDLNLSTFFATVIGIDTLRVHAEAEVELVPSNAGGVLPFGLLAGNSQSEVCLKSGSQPTLPPCDGPITGNFGTVDINFYGNPVLGTPSACTGYPNTRLEVNIALGIDHLMSTYVSGTPTHEEVACPDLAIHPNQLDGITGLRTHTLDFGLIDGLSLDGHPIEGRLSRGPWATANVRSGSPRIDDKPLWAFLDPGLTDTEAPPECRPSVTTITTKAQMATCLDAYKRRRLHGRAVRRRPRRRRRTRPPPVAAAGVGTPVPPDDLGPGAVRPLQHRQLPARVPADALLLVQLRARGVPGRVRSRRSRQSACRSTTTATWRRSPRSPSPTGCFPRR